MKRLYLLIMILLIATPLFAQENAATKRLTEQSRQFEEQVIEVADNVYTAVGFSVSNVSMIVGENGVVIVDTGMMLDDAGRIATAFRKQSGKPVKAIIFTHSHGDHTGGAAAFLGVGVCRFWDRALNAVQLRPVVDRRQYVEPTQNGNAREVPSQSVPLQSHPT